MSDIFIVTGEASGDAVGARFAEHLRAQEPRVSIEGIGASRMREAGIPLFADSGEWAAIGIMEAVPLVWKLTRLLARLKRRLLLEPPRVLVLVDFGAFNVRLGTWARRHGIRTVYLMPSGSWRRTAGMSGLRKMAASADLFLSPFAANTENLRRAGAEAIHIGHPILEMAGADGARREERREKSIALLPGSRSHEVETLAPVMARMAADWPRRIDRFVMVKAPSYPAAKLDALLEGVRPDSLEVVEERVPDVLARCDLAVVCSGTATLEAAIAGVPMVVVYDGPALMRLEWRLRKRGLKIPAIALPNIIAGEHIVPELVAEDVTPENIITILHEYARFPHKAREMRERFADVRAALEPRDALATAARYVLDIADLPAA